MYNSSSGSKLNMAYRKNQLALSAASEEDSEESDEESEEEQPPSPKPKRKPATRLRMKSSTKGGGQSRSSFGGKQPRPKAPITMDMTNDTSDEDAPPTKKARKGKAKEKGRAKVKKARRTLGISESPSKVKLGSTVVANSSLSQQEHTLSVEAMLRKKISEFQVTTPPLFTYLLSESTANRSLPVLLM
jgi:hypothetical protein